jgi:catechol 2,3-dioxygenase-like lactoylglutathione lyase family enzyme
VTSRGFAEIVLIVDDVRRAARFYEDVVGLDVREPADDDWAWFWAGERDGTQSLALHRGTLLFEEHSPLPRGERFGRIHYAFHVDRTDLGAALERVRAAGVDLYGPVDFDWMDARSYYFYDPDANLLEYWSPNRP